VGARGDHHPPPARDEVEAGQERGPGQGPHAIRAGRRYRPLRGSRGPGAPRQRTARGGLAGALLARRPMAMFVDRVKIFVKGGDGGRGCVSFRRESYVPRGGPDGGVGGKGGDVVLQAVSHHNTLLPLRYHTEHRAERGEHGGPGNRTGRSGADLVVSVPPGTIARDEASSEMIGEVLFEGDRLVLARGGRGGR